MPIDKTPNDWSFIKIFIYLAAVILGLASKLATINRKGMLTMREVIFQTSVAFASAFIVGAIFYYHGQYQTAIILAVVIGRFGDSILIAAGKTLQNWLTKNIDNDKT